MTSAADRAGQFTVTTEQVDGRYSLLLSGELDIATADQMKAALDAVDGEAGSELVIDLSSVTFMDSTGLRLLIEANKYAVQVDQQLVIVTGDSPAKRVLELTRMDEHLRVVAAL